MVYPLSLTSQISGSEAGGKLSATGNPATLEQVKVVGERNQGGRDFRLETLPDLSA